MVLVSRGRELLPIPERDYVLHTLLCFQTWTLLLLSYPHYVFECVSKLARSAAVIMSRCSVCLIP